MNKSALAISLCVVLVACGGGGGGGGTPDTQPPVVISLDPPNNSIGADVGDSISVVFNEAIDATSVTTTSFTMQPAIGGSAVAGTHTVSGSTVRFVPTAALVRSTLYTATIASTVRDAAGNSLGANTVWSFTSETDAWQATTNDANTPSGRDGHTAVWTGTEMIVWGGRVTGVTGTDTGARYLPTSGSTPGAWTPTAMTTAPLPRSGHTAIWSGSEMIVWGGNVVNVGADNSGARYTPGVGTGAGSWTTTTLTGAPSPRSGHTAVWTGSEMIIWGGLTATSGLSNDGGRYTPGASGGSWSPLATTPQAPSARDRHTAVWTGTEMIVWGGSSSGATSSGARYNPTTNTWAPTSTVGAPAPRFSHKAIWTGTEMIVWGGTDGVSPLNTGGRYDPSSNTWTAISTLGAPSARVGHTITWTGLEMIIWGGDISNVIGARYRPSTNTWKAMTTTDSPTARTDHTAVWTGTNVIVWGGWNGTTMGDGGQYTP